MAQTTTGGGDDSSTSREWEIYDFAVDCATSDYPRAIHPRETWEFLQDAYAESTGEIYPREDPYHGFTIPFDVKDDGPRGRSVYAAEAIPEGTKFYKSKNIVGFRKEADLTSFLRLLPHDLQCDVLLWAWGSSSGANLCLDEGSFVNHGEESELITHRNTKTLRDILPGEELLEDYGVFVHTDGGWFNELRARSWGEMRAVGEGGAEIDGYTSQGAVVQKHERGMTRSVRWRGDGMKSTPPVVLMAFLFGVFVGQSRWFSLLRNKQKHGV